MILEYENIAQQVKQDRIKAGLSQTELARKAGVSRYTIAKVENGEYKHVRFSNVMSICKSLGWNVNTSYGLRHL